MQTMHDFLPYVLYIPVIVLILSEQTEFIYNNNNYSFFLQFFRINHKRVVLVKQWF